MVQSEAISVTGGSLDWTKEKLGIPYTFTMELRDDWNSDMRGGMMIAPSEIIPNAEEVWAFHKEVARQVIREFGNETMTSL